MGTYDICFLDSGPIRHRVREWYPELNDVCTAFLHGKHNRYSVFGCGVPRGDECHQRRAGLAWCRFSSQAMYEETPLTDWFFS